MANQQLRRLLRRRPEMDEAEFELLQSRVLSRLTAANDSGAETPSDDAFGVDGPDEAIAGLPPIVAQSGEAGDTVDLGTDDLGTDDESDGSRRSTSVELGPTVVGVMAEPVPASWDGFAADIAGPDGPAQAVDVIAIATPVPEDDPYVYEPAIGDGVMDVGRSEVADDVAESERATPETATAETEAPVVAAETEAPVVAAETEAPVVAAEGIGHIAAEEDEPAEPPADEPAGQASAGDHRSVFERYRVPPDARLTARTDAESDPAPAGNDAETGASDEAISRSAVQDPGEPDPDRPLPVVAPRVVSEAAAPVSAKAKVRPPKRRPAKDAKAGSARAKPRTPSRSAKPRTPSRSASPKPARTIVAPPVVAEAIAAPPIAAPPIAAPPITAPPVADPHVAAAPITVPAAATQATVPEPVAAHHVAARPVAAKPVAARPVAARTIAPGAAPAIAPVAASCPYCAFLLQPPPEANRRCPRCRERIIVKRVDGRVVYLTEASVLVFEAERRRMTNAGRWTRERGRWLKVAADVDAPVERIARLGAALLSEEVVAASRALYVSTVERAFRSAKHDRRWEDASRIMREHALVLYRIAGSPIPPPEDVLKVHREGAAAALRGIGGMARDAELVSAGCCDICQADDGRTFPIAEELRAPRLPHVGCPRGLCRCDWYLAVRDQTMVRRHLRRRARADARAVSAVEAPSR